MAARAERRFLADRMLARLARWLRMAGEDVTLPARPGTREPSRAALLRQARAEGRLVLTRDRGFPSIAREGLLLTADRLDDLLAEFYGSFPADPLARAFARCTLCNADVEALTDPAAIAALPPLVRARGGAYRRCVGCGHVYWEGSHSARIRARLAAAAARADGGPARAAPALEDHAGWERFDWFLRALLDRLGLTWSGYRRPRRSLRTPLGERIAALGLAGWDAYLAYLDGHPSERERATELLAVSVTRFFRDREDWFHLAATGFEPLARAAAGRGGTARAASLGCASGEEPFTLRMLWDSPCALEITGFDIRSDLIERAAEGVCTASSVHSVPEYLLERWFTREDRAWRLDHAIRRSVRFERRDVYADPPRGPYDLVLCRNLAFTYLSDGARGAFAEAVVDSLDAGGFLMIGGNETLPRGVARRLTRVGRCLYRRG